MTTFHVSRVVRPLDEGMFADLGYPTVSFAATADGGCDVTVDATLTAAQVARAKCRLWSDDDTSEADLWHAYQAVQDIDTFLATTSPTSAQVVAQVQALSRDVKALIRLAVQEIVS